MNNILARKLTSSPQSEKGGREVEKESVDEEEAGQEEHVGEAGEDQGSAGAEAFDERRGDEVQNGEGGVDDGQTGGGGGGFTSQKHTFCGKHNE